MVEQIDYILQTFSLGGEIPNNVNLGWREGGGGG